MSLIAHKMDLGETGFAKLHFVHNIYPIVRIEFFSDKMGTKLFSGSAPIVSVSVQYTNHQFLHCIHFPVIRRDRLSGLFDAMKSVQLASASFP